VASTHRLRLLKGRISDARNVGSGRSLTCRASAYVKAIATLTCASVFGNALAQTPLSFPAPAGQPVQAAPQPGSDASVMLPGAARLVALPSMTESQVKEFISDLLQDMALTSGYRRAGADAPKLPPLPEQVSEAATVLRRSNGKVDIIQFGYILAARRHPRLYAYGVSIGPGGVQPNPDAAEAALDPVMKKLLTEAAKVRSRMPVAQLRARVINLSYIDADAALFALRAMGYSAVTDEHALAPDDAYRGRDVALLSSTPATPAAPSLATPPDSPPGTPIGSPMGSPLGLPMGSPMGISMGMTDSSSGSMSGSSMGSPFGAPTGGQAKSARFAGIKHLPMSIDYDRLPLVIKMPAPEAQNVGLVGFDGASAAATQGANSLGLSMVPTAAAQLGPTIAAGTSQLLILTDPGDIEQFNSVKRVVEDVIDKPARQVFVESLVLEISQRAIEELGVQWSHKGGANSLQIGTLVQLTPNAGQSALQLARDTLKPFDPSQFLARINALIDRNQAEILSRPSVLTLDNRQATIRVGTDIPIATSKDASSGAAGGRVAFSFQYLPTGILLNVRPRISEEGREISMLIDATVSATVPGQDLRLVDPATGVTLASAPTISTRRVQTYARITNNTPLIIGGLVSRDQTKQEDKVPRLSDIPFLGKLFGYQSDTDSRREVIIVLTPSVLTEEFRATKPQLPKDDDRFDLSGTTLFREAHRIRAEDLIDSQYIRFNQRLLKYRKIANEMIRRNPDLATVQPFAQFRGTRVPAEFIFVSGMMHRMLARLKVGDPVKLDKLMFFEGVKGAEFKSESVGGLLKRLGDGKTHKSFFEKNPGKALTLRFRYARGSDKPGEFATEPLAEVRVVPCADRAAWKKLLWDLNQPVDGEQQHYTIVLHDESDLESMKLAIALKNTILANGNEAGTIFDNFLPGRMLAMQEIAPDWERQLEANVARYFYWGELFYPAFADEHERAIEALDRAIRRPDMAKDLSGIALP
jgi:general secretion pathway protein D